ncbi:MAG: hypothetical protein V7604_3084 [Hyphomicrobiales bacterium]
MMTRTALAPIAVVIGVAAFAASANAQSPAGVWLTKDQDAHVRIAGCGGALCGTASRRSTSTIPTRPSAHVRFAAFR